MIQFSVGFMFGVFCCVGFLKYQLKKKSKMQKLEEEYQEKYNDESEIKE